SPLGLALAGACALVVAPRAVAAAPGSEPIVLEAHGGPRPADADRLLRPVLAELARSGFTGPPAVAQRIDGSLSRPAASLADERAAEAVRIIESGYKLFLSGKFDRAAEEIERGLRVLHAAPAALVGKNDDRRDAVMRGLIGLALSHKRRGRTTQAAEAMKELVRSFPDRELSYKDYGPEPHELFDAVRRDLDREGKGSIAVDLDDDRTVVFIDEHYVNSGDVKIPDLYPGTYRLFLQQGNRFGRVHDVVVEAGSTTAVSLSWQLDAVLHTDGGVALVFDDEAARREMEPRFAVRLARALGAPSVVVLGIRENRGRRSVVGAFYAADSTRPLRSGAVAVEPVVPGVERFEALARLLAGDDEAAALVAPLGDEARKAPVPAAAREHRDTGGRPLMVWKWLTLGVGLGAVAGGVTLYAADNGGGSRDQFERNTRSTGIAIASAGAALTGLGIYFFFRDHSDRIEAEESAHSAALVPVDGGGAALVLGGRF
ncbi:MAG TPA: hypothetical protein VKB80_20870, partial [Kofleriaceae bacterium]|nr:hypothetical protein [Kofleriaceae bacterium]